MEWTAEWPFYDTVFTGKYYKGMFDGKENDYWKNFISPILDD